MICSLHSYSATKTLHHFDSQPARLSQIYKKFVSCFHFSTNHAKRFEWNNLRSICKQRFYTKYSEHDCVKVPRCRKREGISTRAWGLREKCERFKWKLIKNVKIKMETRKSRDISLFIISQIREFLMHFMLSVVVPASDRCYEWNISFSLLTSAILFYLSGKFQRNF